MTTQSHSAPQPGKHAPLRQHRAAAERRWSDRIQEALPVVLHCHGSPPLHARSRNISLGGMFIETEAGTASITMPAVVSFSLNRGNERRYYRLGVELIRLADDGAAVMYRSFDSEIVRALREMLYAVRGEDATPDSADTGHGAQVRGG